MDGRVAQDAAIRWLAPAARAADEAAGFLDPQPERVREIFRVTRDLRLLEVDGDDWVATAPLPATRREFALRAHAHLRDLAADDADAVVLRAYAWFVAYTQRVGLAGLVSTKVKASEIVNQLSEALGKERGAAEGKAFGSTKYPAWKDWMAFLGLGWNDLPGASGFQPDPSRRIAEELPALIEQGRRMEAHEFVATLAKNLPYLDGGPLLIEALEAQGVRHTEGQLCRLTSAALRGLHDEEVLRLFVEGDVRKGIALFPDALHSVQFVSHIQYVGGP
jgi:hypothetical protein